MLLLLPVEVIASLGNFGIDTAFIAGVLCEKVGARVTVLCGLLLSVAGSLLLWSTTLMTEFYQSHVFLQYIYFFMGGRSCFFFLILEIVLSSLVICYRVDFVYNRAIVYKRHNFLQVIVHVIIIDQCNQTAR